MGGRDVRDSEESDLPALLAIYNAVIAHVMLAGVDAANTASIRFHRRRDCERAGQLREVGSTFGRWLDPVFLQRRIGPR
jgi:phosphinothricin acetyltransferase